MGCRFNSHGSSRTNRDRRTLLGSVSNYVLHHASCAVLTLNIPSHGSVPDESEAMG
ncbi:MAG: universal stress protein [Acaryochloridaceae cyanobacterium RU_4_10]|nr:universal stress protein [Acaryochloridaceae cyanobacterium RU_4_10]